MGRGDIENSCQCLCYDVYSKHDVYQKIDVYVIKMGYLAKGCSLTNLIASPTV